jgi:ribosome-binding factor A
MSRFHRNSSRRFLSGDQNREIAPTHDRHTMQMCGEVRRTLDLVLTGECDDDVLRGLYVQSVVPAPDAAHLLVTVSPLDPGDATPAHTILEHLRIFTGKLRTSVAESINRRRAPDLMFNIAAGEGM